MGVLEELIEEWKPITGYEGYYEISNFGRVKSLSRIAKGSWYHKNRVLRERILKHGFNGVGRPVVDLRSDEKRGSVQIARLVVNAFLDNPDGLTDINHKDGNPLNNHVSNLEWATRSDNLKHAWDTGLKKHYATNLSETDIKKIRIYREFGCSLKTIAEIFNCSFTYVCNICNGKNRADVPNDLEYEIHTKD